MADGKIVEEKDVGQFVMVPFEFIRCVKYMKKKHQARWLYVVLLHFRNASSGKAWPSYQTLHEWTGLTRQSISDGLKELEYWGWLKRYRRFGSSTIYYVYMVRQRAQADLDHEARKARAVEASYESP